ncbi:MAG: UDP-N-acetylmuramoyl-tripeptide--D-alanyl-D-alanine ligase [Lactobacillaceae bacterium]|nr:UDP-N-acetylmuramoyl-tripeptide--D-alanyl-D-alanine ligase [Lactobacillaceae bacterium]
MHYTPAKIAKLLNGQLINDQAVVVTNTVFDGRKATPGSLFIPIIGANDGHDYVAGAIANGAVATLWQADHKNIPTDIAVIVVPNTQTAFQQLAAAYLNEIHPQVVAISGSNGKTTTKDFTAAIAAMKYKTVKTPANFNNEIGVPATILAMPEDTELLVVEFGMDRPGDLKSLSTLYKPDITVLTMIGEAHIEFFKTRERIADGKMEIISGMPASGTLVYNGDEQLLRERTAVIDGLNTKTFGLAPQNDLFATQIAMTPVQATFTTNQTDSQFTIPMTGRYNVSNSLAAIAVGQLLDISMADMIKALATAPVTENRTEWLAGNFGGKILSDVYNSNPTAAKEVLHFFSQTPTTGKRVVVLGDMLELGTAGPELHASLADSLDPAAIEQVYLVGPIMRELEKALQGKYPAGRVTRFEKEDKDALANVLKQNLQADDLVMLKGSHGIHLENVVEALL